MAAVCSVGVHVYCGKVLMCLVPFSFVCRFEKKIHISTPIFCFTSVGVLCNTAVVFFVYLCCCWYGWFKFRYLRPAQNLFSRFPTRFSQTFSDQRSWSQIWSHVMEFGPFLFFLKSKILEM